MSLEPSPPESFDFTVDAPAPASMDTRKSSYSLLLLFYITTVAAILAAVCRLAFVENAWSAQAMVVGYLIVGGVSVIMAMVLGYFVGRTLLSTLLGLLAGLICGLVVWLMMLVQPTHYASAGMILGGGCWILSIVAIVGNRWQQSA